MLLYVGNIFFFALSMHRTYIHRPMWKSMLTHSICELQRALKNIGATLMLVALSPLSLPSLSCATLCIAKSTQRPVNFWRRLHEVVAWGNGIRWEIRAIYCGNIVYQLYMVDYPTFFKILNRLEFNWKDGLFERVFGEFNNPRADIYFFCKGFSSLNRICPASVNVSIWNKLN